MNSKIWLSSPHMSGNEMDFIQEAFDGNWIAPLGPNVTSFEDELSDFVGNEKEVAVLNSGTAAIHLALAMLGVSIGDEVLCQSFTFAASVNPVLYVGAKPIFIDSEPITWNMSPELLEKAILERMNHGVKPKAIIAVHLYGMPYNIEKIHEISKKYEIPVIEDAAEAVGSKVNGMNCGGFGDYGVFSFNGNKIITSSGGGALIIRTKEEKNKAVFLGTQARDDAAHYEHSQMGYNYRMSNVIAGIGRGQLQVIDERVQARRNNFEYYVKQLSNTDFQFLKEPTGCFSNRWLTTILTNSFESREKNSFIFVI